MVVALLAGCGRVGFDDVSSRAGDAGGDATDAPGVATLHTQAVSASNADPDDHFGVGLAVSRDGSTLVVGAPQEDSNNIANPGDNTIADSGAAYVYTLAGSSWAQQAFIKPFDVASAGNFGYAVALSANGNVLAVGEPAPTTTAGIAHVFTRSGTTWSTDAIVIPAIGDQGDRFGFSIALSDAGDTLFVGAPGESSAQPGNPNDNSANSAGAAYVFVKNGASWTQQAYLKAGTPAAMDQLGWAIACSADGNTVAIGAPGVANNIGEVYVFTRVGTTWSSSASVTEPTMVAGDFYGFAVAMRGDASQIIVGSPGEDSVVANSGAAYTLSGASQPQLKAPNADDNDQLGLAVAIADDGTPFAGAALEDGASRTDQGNNSAMDSGAVYRFGSAPLYFKELAPAAGNNFGQPIAVSGDGRTLAASAVYADPGGLVDSGAVTIEYFAP